VERGRAGNIPVAVHVNHADALATHHDFADSRWSWSRCRRLRRRKFFQRTAHCQCPRGTRYGFDKLSTTAHLASRKALWLTRPFFFDYLLTRESTPVFPRCHQRGALRPISSFPTAQFAWHLSLLQQRDLGMSMYLIS